MKHPILICPSCKSQNIVSDGSSVEFFSHAYKCLDCDYRGPAVELVKIKKSNKKKAK